MSDLIDRQAAIVQACKQIKDDYVAHDVKEALKAIPSAQPEETFEFGKWYDFKRGYVLETTTHSFRILKDVEASSNE